MSAPPSFLTAFDALPAGYQSGLFMGERSGATITGRPGDGVRKLFGERLAGGDPVSFNLYATGSGAKLKPCEMPEAKVINFVIGFLPEADPPAPPSELE